MRNGNMTLLAIVFILLMQVTLVVIAYNEHEARRAEHTRIECAVRLNFYVYLSAVRDPTRFKEMTWRDIPQEYWGCLPSSLLGSR